MLKKFDVPTEDREQLIDITDKVEEAIRDSEIKNSQEYIDVYSISE